MHTYDVNFTIGNGRYKVRLQADTMEAAALKTGMIAGMFIQMDTPEAELDLTEPGGMDHLNAVKLELSGVTCLK